MSWRKGIIELGYKRNSYKSFKSCKKKERRLSKQIDTYKSGVFKGTHGFVQRNKLLEKDSIYRNFNIKHRRYIVLKKAIQALIWKKNLALKVNAMVIS